MCFFEIYACVSQLFLHFLRLQAAALNQLEVVKERSVAGLQAAVENHSFLDLNVAFAASNIIVPEHGTYRE